MLGRELGASDTLGNSTTPDPHPQPCSFLMTVLTCHADTFFFTTFHGHSVSHFPQGCYLWILVQNQILCIRKYHIILPRRRKWVGVGKLKDRCDVPKGLWLLWIFSHPHLAPASPQHVPSVTFGLCQEGFQSSLCQLFWFCFLFFGNPRTIQLSYALLSVILYGLNSCVVPGILLWADGCLFFSILYLLYADKEGCPCLRGTIKLSL